MDRKDYLNRCFSPNWLEVDLEKGSEACYELAGLSGNTEEGHISKEVRLESKRRKDLNTLLKELEDIKQNIEKAAEKQHRLANLMNFYTGELT